MDYCTIEDGAKFLNCSRPTIYKLISAGKLKRHEVLGRPALKIAELRQFKKKSQAGRKKRK